MAKKKQKKQKNQYEKPTQHVFQKGDLVLAKVKGYPAWPGLIETVEAQSNGRHRYHVKFFATNDKSCSFVEIKLFENASASELKCNRKGFNEALALCKEEYGRRRRDETGKCTSRPLKRVAFNRSRPRLEPNQAESPSSEKEIQEGDAKVEEERHHHTPEIKSTPDEGSDSDKNPVSLGELDHDDEQTSVKPEPTDLSCPTERQTNDIQKAVSEMREKEVETENIKHVDTNGTSSLPDSTTKDEESPEQKSDDSSKDCSLNDLTSEKANADRGRKKASTKLQPNPIQETKKELTIAKLKKKIDLKLEEKANLKRAILERKSFEKASKILPKFILMFEPLTTSSHKLLLDELDDKKATNQFKTSIRNCEKYLDLLEKCLKVMISDYGKRQKDSYQFRNVMIDIVTDLKKLKKSRPKSDPVSRDSSHLLKLFKDHKAIKDFINSDEISNFSSESITERKENATKRGRLVR